MCCRHPRLPTLEFSRLHRQVHERQLKTFFEANEALEADLLRQVQRAAALERRKQELEAEQQRRHRQTRCAGSGRADHLLLEAPSRLRTATLRLPELRPLGPRNTRPWSLSGALTKRRFRCVPPSRQTIEAYYQARLDEMQTQYDRLLTEVEGTKKIVRDEAVRSLDGSREQADGPPKSPTPGAQE